MSIFELMSALLVLSAALGFVNRAFVRLPNAVGILLLGLGMSLLLLAVGLLFPQIQMAQKLRNTLDQIDFTHLVFDGVLAFLLFSGALNVDLSALRRRWRGVLYLALIATPLSTVLAGTLFWLAARWLSVPLELPWAMVFGALISPTDPVGVLRLLKGVQLPAELKSEAEGEALFNDGIGVVLFTLIAGFATGEQPFSWFALGVDFLREAVGGVALGLVTGYLAYRGLKKIDDFAVEVLITLALVTGTYAIAQRLGTSGPAATVVAGLLIGYRAPKDAMSNRTGNYVDILWTLIDEVLNAVLFLLIGLQVIVIGGLREAWGLALLAIPLVLIARLISVTLPLLLPIAIVRSPANIPFLTWAGIRGGISIALVFALPGSETKTTLIAATYAVVLFSIVAQGLSLPLLARRLKLDDV